MVISYQDALGRSIQTQWYSQPGNHGANITNYTRTSYNALDKPTSVLVKDLTPQSGQSITQVTTTATYDDLGRTTSLNDPDRGVHTLTYDADGRQITDVSGTRTIGISYDLLGRVRCVQDGAPTTDGSGGCSTGSNPLLVNTYGQSFIGDPNTDFVVGRLTQSVATTYYHNPDNSTYAASTTQQLRYDERGRTVATNLQVSLPTSWGVTTPLPTYKQTTSYNDADQVTTVQTFVGSGNGYIFSQAYDSTTGQLVGLSNNSTAAANLATLGYDGQGQLSTLNFQTTTGTPLATASFTYNGLLRPATSTASWQSGSGTTGTIFSSGRTYDPVGNVTSTQTTHAVVPGVSNSGGSETQVFCYDEQNRLVWAGNSGTVPAAGNGTCGSATPANTLGGAGYTSSYSYTDLGQLWQGPLNGVGSQQQYLYCDSTHPHQLSAVSTPGATCASLGTPGYQATYDSWGNLKTRMTNSISADLSFDVKDHLVQWSSGSTNKEFALYDASGERVFKRDTTSAGTTLTVYAFGLEEHRYTADGSVNLGNTYYYSLAGHLIGKFDGSTTQYSLTDALGSVVSSFTAVAGSASLVGNQDYGPYGNQRYLAGSLGTEKGFTGQYADSLSGLDYYHARYYDPVVGRFASADIKQGNGQGMDPYAYVKGNPTTLTDPTGESTRDTNRVAEGEPAEASRPPTKPPVPPPPSSKTVFHPAIPPGPPGYDSNGVPVNAGTPADKAAEYELAQLVQDKRSKDFANSTHNGAAGKWFITIGDQIVNAGELAIGLYTGNPLSPVFLSGSGKPDTEVQIMDYWKTVIGSILDSLHSLMINADPVLHFVIFTQRTPCPRCQDSATRFLDNAETQMNTLLDNAAREGCQCKNHVYGITFSMASYNYMDQTKYQGDPIGWWDLGNRPWDFRKNLVQSSTDITTVYYQSRGSIDLFGGLW